MLSSFALSLSFFNIIGNRPCPYTYGYSVHYGVLYTTTAKVAHRQPARRHASDVGYNRPAPIWHTHCRILRSFYHAKWSPSHAKSSSVRHDDAPHQSITSRFWALERSSSGISCNPCSIIRMLPDGEESLDESELLPCKIANQTRPAAEPVSACRPTANGFLSTEYYQTNHCDIWEVTLPRNSTTSRKRHVTRLRR